MNFIDRYFAKRLSRRPEFISPILDGIKAEVDSRLEPLIMEMQLGQMVKGQIMGWENRQESYIKEGFRKNADVYAVTSLVYEWCARIPWKLMDEDPEGNQEEITDHTILQVNEKPNPNESGKEYKEALFGYLTVTGNGIANGVKLEAGVNRGEYRQLYVLPTELTEVVASGDFRNPIEGYTLRWGTKKHLLSRDDIMHVKTWNPNYLYGNNFMGMSPIEAGAMAIISSNSGQEAKARKYTTGGMDGFIGADAKDAEFTTDQGLRLSEFIRAKYAGYKNVYVTGARAKWNQMGMSVVDLAILEALDADLRKIAALWKVDSKLLNDPKASTYNNMTEAEKSTCLKAVKPRVEHVINEMNSWFVASYNSPQSARFHGTKGKLKLVADWSGEECLQEDKNKHMERLNAMIAVKPADQLRAMGLEVEENDLLNEYWVQVPGGRIPLSDYQQRNLPADVEAEAEKAIKKLVEDNNYLLYGNQN